MRFVYSVLAVILILLVLSACSLTVQLENGHAVSMGEGDVADQFEPDSEALRSTDEPSNRFGLFSESVPKDGE
ncbi:hypothetical protein [Vibrio jasicida]|uniref:hypothetical protein n=1 Tax=Vibrio jasicida TaxID=766224 RepID=UPI0005F0B058|nr:hypothetical protein [Vibrio jasicida]